ncbi:hypothetical protein ACYCSU_17030 [Paenibacillus sp. ALE1]
MLIELKRLPEEIRNIIRERTNDKVIDVWWANSCNNEGEDFHELYIDSNDSLNNLYFKYGWGEITSLEEALEELE